MKIAFSGAHRTGKSSLANRIANEINFTMQFTEVEKTFKTRTVKETENLSGIDGFYERILQQNLILDHVLNFVNHANIYSIFDRSAFDVLGYSSVFLNMCLLNHEITHSEYAAKDTHLQTIQKHLNGVDFTFIVQPGIHFESDLGSGSQKTQEVLNDEFLQLAEDYLPKDKYFVIPRTIVDFEARVALCKDILYEKFNLN